jgi:hypothetical protein
LVAFAIDPFSLQEVLLLLLSLPHLEHLFNQQGLKPRQTRLSTRAEATVACGGFFSVKAKVPQQYQSSGDSMMLEPTLFPSVTYELSTDREYA